MAQTVTEVLTAGTDSVTLINEINDNGVEDMDQAEINEVVQRNVDHLSTILLYAPVDGDDDQADIVGAASSKKTTHVAAVTTGNAYIAAN